MEKKLLIFYYHYILRQTSTLFFLKMEKYSVLFAKNEKNTRFFSTSKKYAIIRALTFRSVLMNENAIVKELYAAIENHELMNTICAVFGKGAQVEIGYTQKLCEMEVKALDALSVRFTIL